MTGMLQFLEYKTGLSFKLCNLYNRDTWIREESGLCCQKSAISSVQQSALSLHRQGTESREKKNQLRSINSFILYLQLLLKFQHVHVYLKTPINNRKDLLTKTFFKDYAAPK